MWLKERLLVLTKFYKTWVRSSHIPEEEFSMAKKVTSQSEVCRSIIDRGDVMAQQILTAVVENVGEKLDDQDLAGLKRQINGIATKHMDAVVSTVLSIL